MVTKTFQVYKGTSIEFEQRENKMEDVFTIYFDNHDSISATTWCNSEFKENTIKNGSRLQNPLQCGTYSPYDLFFRGVDVRADQEKRSGKGLLNREINSGGLVVTVENHEVEREVNSTREHHGTIVRTSSWGFSLTNILMVIGGWDAEL